MTSQPETINVAAASIAPVQLKPPADTLLVYPERSAKIRYILGSRIPGTPAIPGIVGVGKVVDAGGKVITSAIEGRPAVAAVPNKLDPVSEGTIEMTDDEWAAWTNQEDETYRISVVAKRLGLTLTPAK